MRKGPRIITKDPQRVAFGCFCNVCQCPGAVYYRGRIGCVNRRCPNYNSEFVRKYAHGKAHVNGVPEQWIEKYLKTGKHGYRRLGRFRG